MKKLAQLVACVAALGLFAAAMSVFVPQRLDAAPGASNVQVVNTPATPVPVTGSVNAAVTGSVTVGGTVSLANGTSVGLASGATVGVSNVAGNPLAVREAGDGRVPSNGSAGCFFNASNCLIDLTTVAPGYRLVIEHISGQINVNAQLVSAQVGLAYQTCCTLTNDDFLVPQMLPGSATYSHFNHQTLMFFEQNQTVRVALSAGSAQAFGSAAASFAGYLIPY